MESYVIIGVTLAFPLVLGLIMRVSAPHLFFSVMAGELLARYFGDEAESALHTMFNNSAITEYGHLIVLIIPILLTAIFLRGSLKHSKLLLHIFPLAVTGLVFAAFALPLLPASVLATVRSTELGAQLLDVNSTIIGVVIILQLLGLWLLNSSEKSGKKHKKK
jgi:hypothetical protein